LLAKGTFRSWKIDLKEIVEIKALPVLSFCDEVGIIIEEKHSFFFTDAEPWFRAVCDKLELDRHLGDDWHRRAEEGEVLGISFQ